jgi:calcineurin-like phosphoesterase family protein
MKKLIATIALFAISACSATETRTDETVGLSPVIQEPAGLSPVIQEPAGPITLAAVGDISCNTAQRKSYDCRDAEVAELIRSENPDRLLLLGDIQYHSSRTVELEENFGVIWADLIDRSIPIPGNHEYASGSALDYYRFFPRYSALGYYTVDINDTWTVVAINTNDNCRYVACGAGSEQYEWIKEKLSRQRCFIAISHHPRYSTGPHGSSWAMKDMYQLLSENGVSLLISGHDHHYERFETEPAQIVVGTGGKDLRRAKGAENSVKIDDKYGALFVTVEGRTLHTEFRDIDGMGHDGHKITCDK